MVVFVAPPQSSSTPFLRVRASGVFWVREVVARGGAGQPGDRSSWVESDGRGGWRRWRGRPREGTLTQAEATARMLELVAAHDAEQTAIEAEASGAGAAASRSASSPLTGSPI